MHKMIKKIKGFLKKLKHPCLLFATLLELTTKI